MDLPSIETAGIVTVYVYAIVVAAWVAGRVAYPIISRRRVGATVGPVRPLARVVIEYVGNTDWPASLSFGDQDRRRNWASRVLMDHVRGQASARDATPSEVEQLVEELREAIRSAEGVD
jgi:hypothetical protein